MSTLSKFQKFEIETISRDEIHGAPYNPRTITEGAKKRLKRMLKRHGLVSTLVWNRRTGRLVSGHQRLEALDALEGSRDYALHVAVVDVDEREEKALNIQLNNPSMQGEWDTERLTDMAVESELSFDEMGFSEADAEILFGGDSRLADLFHDDEGVVKAKSDLNDIKKHRAEAMEKMRADNSADFYVTVVAQSPEEKSALCRALGVPEYETFVSSDQVFQRLSK